MTLLGVPHFGRKPQINACIHFLLSRLHGNFLWLDHPYPVDIDAMHWVLGFPKNGEDPVDVILARDATIKKVYERYGAHHGTKGAIILIINDHSVHFVT